MNGSAPIDLGSFPHPFWNTIVKESPSYNDIVRRYCKRYDHHPEGVDQAQLFNCQINGNQAPRDKHGNDKEDTDPFLSKEVLSRQGVTSWDINDQGNDGPYNRVEDGVEIAL